MYSAKGHTMSFLKDFLLRDVAITLPRLAIEVQFLLIASKNKNTDQPRYLWVRRAVVERWLRHLLTQPHYAGVLIDQAALSALPLDGPVLELDTFVADVDALGDDAGPAPQVRHIFLSGVLDVVYHVAICRFLGQDDEDAVESDGAENSSDDMVDLRDLVQAKCLCQSYDCTVS